MFVTTDRFGRIDLEAEDILQFAGGLIGFEDCRHWVLLADPAVPSLAWLQSLSKPEVAMAVVSPRRFVPQYQVRLTRRQIEPLQLAAVDEAYVLAIASQDGDRLTLNLRAPLIVNLDRRIGRQVITSDEQPLQLPVGTPAARVASVAPSGGHAAVLRRAA